MSDREDYSGEFARVLGSREKIQAFLKDIVTPLKSQEADLTKAWRAGFRAKLPFYVLLNGAQQEQMRRIFFPLIPHPTVPLESFDRDDLVRLDFYAEAYILQAAVFTELMDKHKYLIVETTKRNSRNRIIAMSLSASIFFLDAPDPKGERSFRYDNIYGNRQIPATGRCRLESTIRVAKPLRASYFRSSPVMLLALHTPKENYSSPFDVESQVMGMELRTGVKSIVSSLPVSGPTPQRREAEEVVSLERIRTIREKEGKDKNGEDKGGGDDNKEGSRG